MTTLAIVVLVGLLIGSFLNVCIYRLPRYESVAWPASHCPSCLQPIAPYDNLPLLSFLLLGGTCRGCRAPISWRYPTVELVNGVAYGLIWWRFGAGWEAAVYCLLFSLLLVVTGTDLTHQIIPDVVSLPGIAVGLICAATVLPIGLFDSVLGVLLGGGLLWLLAWASPYLFGREGMGGGDIKLLAMIGAFLGWRATVLTVMAGAMLGSIVGISLMVTKVIRRDQYIPFGPFLAIGALVALFFGKDILDWYLQWFHGGLEPGG